MLYVGDSSMDIAAARAAGSPVIAVSYGYGKDHAGGGDDVQPDGRVDDLTEIVALCVQQTSEKPHLKLYNTGATQRDECRSQYHSRKPRSSEVVNAIRAHLRWMPYRKPTRAIPACPWVWRRSRKFWWRRHLRHNPANPAWAESRPVLSFSTATASMLLYAAACIC